MDEVARQCHASRPARAGQGVRLPGEKGFALAAQQQSRGVTLHPGILEALQPWAQKLRVELPASLDA
jgi:L-lactate dehydrogenase